MTRFKVIPTSSAHASSDIIVPKIFHVLDTFQRLGCKEADVLRDGDYCFSLAIGDNGMWCIFKREPEERPGVYPARH